MSVVFRQAKAIEYEEEKECKEKGRKDKTRAETERPAKGTKVLVHSCCAPCSGAMVKQMLSWELIPTIYFYNPNIHPRKEYEIRKEENKLFARQLDIPFVDADYDAKEWFSLTKGLEYDPERGPRCSICFDMRLEKTASFAFGLFLFICNFF